jgi:hypothetical protein
MINYSFLLCVSNPASPIVDDWLKYTNKPLFLKDSIGNKLKGLTKNADLPKTITVTKIMYIYQTYRYGLLYSWLAHWCSLTYWPSCLYTSPNFWQLHKLQYLFPLSIFLHLPVIQDLICVSAPFTYSTITLNLVAIK